MDVLEALLTRQTVPQAMMAEPGPDAAQLARILDAGAAAPDHGRLRPWRFLLVRGAARAALGQVFMEGLRARQPEASAEALDKAHNGPLRAPVIVVVIAAVTPDHAKIPAIEQITSAAAAAQNMLLAAHGMGLAGKWSTGDYAYDPLVRQRLGLGADDVLIGFIYLGSAAQRPTADHKATARDHTQEWTS